MSIRISVIIAALILAVPVGCGTTQQRAGTEQLLLSDSVDNAVDQVDLSPLDGRRVYLDSTYLEESKAPGFVNSNYIISAIRQKLITSGCLIQESRAEADYIVEARVGALGTDSLEVIYGIPANNVLGQAASVLASAPVVPSVPEIAFGKRNAAMSTSKLVLFAYHRDSGTPVWQSGSAIAKSDAKESWFLGAGPVQRGSIYEGVRFAGTRMRIPGFGRKSKKESKNSPVVGVTVAKSHQFVDPAELETQLAAAAALKAEAVAAEAAAAAADVMSAEIATDGSVIQAGHDEPTVR